ncbi:MAG: hypothetical protein QM754_06680 [Tepidisphaeraceae bacterium]
MGVVCLTALGGDSPLTPAGPDKSANPAGLKLLTSTDGVNVPPKATGQMKFSFSWPEPSLEFAELLFAFEVATFENTYSVDPSAVTVERTADRVVFKAAGFAWAGGQQKAPGNLVATIDKRADGAVEWTASVKFDKPVKAIKSIVRGLPRGRLSPALEGWRDVADNERVFEYPTLMGGMATPLVLLEAKNKRITAISALQTEVRPARFFFWPGPDGYKVELIYEQAAWRKSGDVVTSGWRIGTADNLEKAIAPHFAHVEKAYGLTKFTDRKDTPDWMKHLGLVLSLHGQHWTGYVMNDYAKQLDILKWAATKTDPRYTMVFFAGWDRRYYWDYPTFDVDPRMGGEAGFKKLVTEAKAMGYRTLAMFGSNIANPTWPGFGKIADARARDIYGNPINAGFVDWDGDRHGDGSMTLMNLGVESWRNHLSSRISTIVNNYDIDAYFLDICGFWENNPDADMFTGVQQLVTELKGRHPEVAAVAEMQYDAQMGLIPMSHAARYSLYRSGNYEYVASFDHLSHPAPGRGSTGIHEYGFNRYQPVKSDQIQIPTIAFVDDTFDTYLQLVETDISTANERFEKRGRLT